MAEESKKKEDQKEEKVTMDKVNEAVATTLENLSKEAGELTPTDSDYGYLRAASALSRAYESYQADQFASPNMHHNNIQGVKEGTASGSMVVVQSYEQYIKNTFEGQLAHNLVEVLGHANRVGLDFAVLKKIRDTSEVEYLGFKSSVVSLMRQLRDTFLGNALPIAHFLNNIIHCCVEEWDRKEIFDYVKMELDYRKANLTIDPNKFQH